MKKRVVLSALILLAMTLVFSGCGQQKDEAKEEKNIKTESNLEGFYQNDGFTNIEATINDKGEFSSTSKETSESWYVSNTPIDYGKDFTITAKVDIPTYWNTADVKDGQVGVGIFIGKREDRGKLCFESDLCVISNQNTCVQGQNIKNRLDGDPDEVVFKEVTSTSGVIKVHFDVENNRFELYFNDQLLGTSTIDNTGKVDWKMEEEDQFVVGIMGFSEKMSIEKEFPTITEFTQTN